MNEHPQEALLASLERLHARLDRIEARIDRVEAGVTRVLHEAPAAIAMAADTVDGLAARVGGGDLERRLSLLGGLAERATRPEALAVLERLLARIDRLDEAITLLDQAPGAAAMAVDALDGVAARVAETGIPLHERVNVLLAAAERLSSPEALAVLTVATERLPEIRALLESGVLDPEAVRVVSTAGKALVESRACDCGPVGAFGALGAIREAPIQRALGFAIAFARQFGVALDATPSPTLPTRT